MSDEKSVPESFDTIAARINALGKAVDERFAQVDKRFAQVDKRFGDIDEAFVEQRKYTEFAFAKLRSEMKSGFAEMNGRFARLERKVDRVLDAIPNSPSRRRRRP